MEGFSKEVAFMLRFGDYKEARYMKSQGKDFQKD